MKAFFAFFYLHKKRTTGMAAGWSALILAACLIPGRDVPEVNFPLADKWTHFILFGAFAFLWLCVYRRAAALQGIIVFLLALAFGYAVELLQGSGITEGRSYDLYDVLADSIGGLLGVLMFFLLKKWSRIPT